MRQRIICIVLAALLASCGGGDGGLLARVGPDSHSEPFDAEAAFQVAAQADGYCAVVVFAEPSGDQVTANWSLNSFVLAIDEAGRYSIATSGCVSAEARSTP